MCGGQNCPDEKSCSSKPNLPWFYRQITLTTSEDIEAQICHDQAASNDGVLVRELKLYVQ